VFGFVGARGVIFLINGTLSRKCIVGPPAVAVGLKGDGEARGVLPLAIHTQAWSSPRVEGLRCKWNEPRDPAASLADPTLWQAPLSSAARSGRLNRGRHDRHNGDRRSEVGHVPLDVRND
jgi:hypothetical protein